ncbi:hypothetical protein BAL199_14652 [alpha proteobacterium BAL199]|nr:hypothetical protein BAL199_14652 [alpha proteobacterium BAL199]
MRLVDGVVSPNGLLLFGSEKTLDVEFANVPNRSGSPFDRYLLGSYPELCASTDRSVIMTKFECSAVDDGVLLSGLPNMGNFGHFILNGISKVPVIRQQLDVGWSAIVPTRRMPFHDAVIAYCGLDPAKFVFTGGVRGVRAKRLDVIAEAPMGMWPYNLLAALRAELPRPKQSNGAPRIYLARPDGARRSLVNEDALLEMLSSFDFEIVRPELLPFTAQVEALEAADVVVAPHGSALVPLVFCHGSKRIVEIETKTSYRMALYNFLSHEAVRVPSRRPAVPQGTRVDSLAYAVDLDDARQAVAWAIGR